MRSKSGGLALVTASLVRCQANDLGRFHDPAPLKLTDMNMPVKTAASGGTVVFWDALLGNQAK